MNEENNMGVGLNDGLTSRSGSRLESIAHYIFMATVVLAPISFLPTPYIVLDAVKTLVIAVGTILSAILYGVVAYKERELALPPRRIFWSAILIAVSLAVSSLLSVHAGKSFFGQGFELGSASFLLVILLAGLVAYQVSRRKMGKVSVIYVGMAIPFLLLALLHGLRLIFGPSFLTLGVLSGLTTTLAGTWYDLSVYSIVVALISVSALSFLPLSKRIKILYWVVLLISLVSAFIINSRYIWSLAFLVLLGLTIYMSSVRPRPAGGAVGSFVKRLAWFPLVLCLIAGFLAWKGVSVAGPVIQKLDVSYSTLSLPWQLTLDVDSESIKSSPLLGVGPNHFGKAYLAFKPAGINATEAWGAEFNYGFGLLPTFVATQGMIGLLGWGLFLIFLGILIVRGLRQAPADPQARFVIVSSSFISVFLWLTAIISVPSHAMLFYAIVATALAVGASVAYGSAKPYSVSPRTGSLASRAMSLIMPILVIVGLLWGAVYVKDFAALAYFGSGVKKLTVNNDPLSADKSFAGALSLNASDVYLQARAESGIVRARNLAATINTNAAATATQAIAEEITSVLNGAVEFARSARKYDPTNYYNYVSEARVSELAAGVRMENAYQNAVDSYTAAIRLNPFNPSLYLSLAQLQASQNKLDEALQTLGAALQVKNNYLDAIYFLSQIAAAQGNLKDAIIAARVATEINPNNAILFFQLGLLQYNNKDYNAAAEALEKAVKLQPNYANAQYFLGLSYARLNRADDAIDQFTELAATNPDNQEVAFILTNLQSGRSPFADAQPPVTPTPEKRPKLPIKERGQ